MSTRSFGWVASVLASISLNLYARAQNQFLMPDRDTDLIFRVHDLDNNGMIANPGEVFLWFSAANTAGTLGPMNPSCQAIGKCRVAIIGDQINRNVYRLHDLNDDGDAQDAGESVVFADATNLSLVSFAFPTGAAFDSQCRAYVVNAGNAFGNDGIYRLVDLNFDGDAQDIGEITHFVTDGPSGFGPGNGPYGPQELFFDPNDVGYVHNSTAGLHGIYRLADGNLNGRADDAGEMTLYFGAGNLSGLTVAAGFAMEPDLARPGAMYMLQTAAGSLDQLIRVTDLNNDLDAQDAGEAVIVFSIATTFINIDAESLHNGDVLVTDNSGNTVLRLRDNSNDGDFDDAGESTIVIAGPGTITQSRQMDALCRIGDANCNGVVDIDDLVLVITNWGKQGACLLGADDNCSGGVDIDDLVAVITHWG